jgi:cold shock CspA family protein
MRGVIARVFLDKGFLFIAAGDRDHFAHKSAFADQDFGRVREGDEVEFVLGDSARGPRAESVRLVS